MCHVGERDRAKNARLKKNCRDDIAIRREGKRLTSTATSEREGDPVVEGPKEPTFDGIIHIQIHVFFGEANILRSIDYVHQEPMGHSFALRFYVNSFKLLWESDQQSSGEDLNLTLALPALPSSQSHTGRSKILLHRQTAKVLTPSFFGADH